MDERYSEIGGACWGPTIAGWNVSWPGARLTGTRAAIELTILWHKHLVFERDTIREIRRYRGLFSTGAQMIHSKEDAPLVVIFWTFEYDHLSSELKKLGYYVRD